MTSEQPNSEPKAIRRLEESLINRIAAGEIIHRPASALKELIENCIDAKATLIRIIVKDGGMKLLQIQDNGTGIRKADLPILAERFTTSKLTSFSDLSSLRTYGFRGEALASISHIANLSVTTKTKTDSCAYRACYHDGALTPAKPGQTADPKPCAGNNGTIITAENLFYNTPTRLSALRNSNEEYHRILEVVTKYAIHNPSIAFICKKAASASSDISTPSNSTVKQTIHLLYGATVARDLLYTSVSSLSVDDGNEGNDTSETEGSWKAEAHFTGANYHAKKFTLLLFINHRLVESQRIKKAIENVYNAILPKGASPFVYLSLEIDPRAVDVNIHPTKREVHFLDEETIVEKVSDSILHTLVGQGRSRTYEYHNQTLLTGGVLNAGDASTTKKDKEKGKGKALPEEDDLEDEDDELEPDEEVDHGLEPGPSKKVYSKDKIRMSQADRTLDSMLPAAGPSSQAIDVDREDDISKAKYRNVQSSDDKSEGDVFPQATQGASSPEVREIEESVCYLTSISDIRKDVHRNGHNFLTDIVRNHIFVGVVDLQRSLSLVQHEKKLYLLNHNAIAESLFYQLGLRQFGNCHRLKLDPPPSVKRLVRLAVKSEKEGWRRSGLDLDEGELVEMIVDKLTARAEMLSEYFSMSINDRGELESLPLLLRNYVPNLDKLPLFLMRLGPQVNWTEEIECFRGFLQELAYFYSPGPLTDYNPSTPVIEEEGTVGPKAERWQIEHVLFPAIKRYLVAPKNLLDRDVVQVASLPDLYRVFERC